MRDPDEHYRYHEGDDMAEWQEKQLMGLFGPPLEALRPIIGTLAHNRQFTYADFEEYCYFRQPPLRVSRGTLEELVKRGLVAKVAMVPPAQFYPTHAGWKWIEGRV